MPFLKKIAFLSDANEPKKFPIPMRVFAQRRCGADVHVIEIQLSAIDVRK